MPRNHRRAGQNLAREDYHDSTAGFVGAPPARSALTLRLILASFGLLACGLGAAAFVIIVYQPVIAGLEAGNYVGGGMDRGHHTGDVIRGGGGLPHCLARPG
jgi:hypothetical protein